MAGKRVLCRTGQAGEVSKTLPESVHVSDLVLPASSLFGGKTSLCPCNGATYWGHGHLPAPILGKLCQARGDEVQLLLTGCNCTSPRPPPIVLAHLAWQGQGAPVTFGGVGYTLVLCTHPALALSRGFEIIGNQLPRRFPRVQDPQSLSH